MRATEEPVASSGGEAKNGTEFTILWILRDYK